MTAQVLAYVRTSTDKQDLNQQKVIILEYARQQHIHINDFIALTMSSRKNQHERRIDELLTRLNPGDTLLVTELSRLGRSTGQVIALIDALVHNDIRSISIEQQLIFDNTQHDLQSLAMLTLLALFAEMERMIISRRTKEALATKKAQGLSLGKPVGTIQHSIYDQDRERIIELLRLGVSERRIATQHLRYGHPSGLNYSMTTRKLRDYVKEP